MMMALLVDGGMPSLPVANANLPLDTALIISLL